MNSKIIPFRLPSAAGPFRCANGEIESSVNAQLIPTAVPGSTSSSDPDDLLSPDDTDSPDSVNFKQTLADLNRLSSSQLPIVEFALTPAPLPGWQNHPANPPAISVDAPKSKDAEGWKTRAAETLSLFHTTARQEHLFTEPFLALSALRLSDGSHILPSSPVLLIPYDRPPRVDSSDNFSLDSMTMTVQGSCARLRCRITVPQSLREWSDRIVALDLFMSDPIPLYNHSAPLLGVHRAAGAASPQSWLPQSFTDSEFTAILLSTSVFHPISTIPLKNLLSGSDNPSGSSAPLSGNVIHEYRDIDFNIPDFSIASSLPTLKAMRNFTPDYLQHHGIEAATAISMSGRLTLADLTLTLPAPPALASLIPHRDSSSEAGGCRAMLQTESVKESKTLYAISYNPDLPPVDISESDFPKWLFIPDPDARQLAITTSDATFIVPLHRHPLLNGAFYWCGSAGYKELSDTGVSKILATAVLPSEPFVKRDTFPLPNALWRSATRQPFLFPDSLLMRPDVTRVIGICRAFRASGLVATTSPTAYLFTDKGIFLLKEMDSGELRDAGLISCHILSAPESIRLSGRTLYFTTAAEEVMALSGTTVKPLATSSGTSSSSPSSANISAEVMISPIDPALPIKIVTRPLKLSSLLTARDTTSSRDDNQSTADVSYSGGGIWNSVSLLAASLFQISVIGAYTGVPDLEFHVSHDLIHWHLLGRTHGRSIDIPYTPSHPYGRLHISGSLSGALEALRLTAP